MQSQARQILEVAIAKPGTSERAHGGMMPSLDLFQYAYKTNLSDAACMSACTVQHSLQCSTICSMVRRDTHCITTHCAFAGRNATGSHEI